MKDHYPRIQKRSLQPIAELKRRTSMEDKNRAKMTLSETKINLRDLDEETIKILVEDKIATGG